MIRTNIADFKAKLSDYLARVEGDETILVCKRNRPIAEVRSAASPTGQALKLGVGAELLGTRAISDQALFEPLPEEFLAGFGPPTEYEQQISNES